VTGNTQQQQWHHGHSGTGSMTTVLQHHQFLTRYDKVIAAEEIRFFLKGINHPAAAANKPDRHSDAARRQ